MNTMLSDFAKNELMKRAGVEGRTDIEFTVDGDLRKRTVTLSCGLAAIAQFVLDARKGVTRIY